MAGYFKVLSIDGGGIRGLIPALVLAKLEALVGPLHKQFDLIAGTSTGGIIAVGLTAPAPGGGGAAFSAGDLVDLYMNDGGAIFYSPVYKRLSHLDDLVERKYDHKPLQKILKKKLSEARLKDALTELLVTSYDLHAGKPYFFKRSKAKADAPRRDHPLWEVARATSAAPTYFEPHQMQGPPSAPAKSLVDGGVFANNPAMCAYAEAMKLKKPLQDILIVSLGTGDEDMGKPASWQKYKHTKAKGWGVIGWARPAINIMMDGVADTVDHQLQQILVDSAHAKPARPQTYFRFQSPLTDETKDMDDADEKSLAALKKLGVSLARKEKAQLEKLASILGA